MVFSKEGIAIKTTFDESQSTLFGAFLNSILKDALNLGHTISEGNIVDLIRIRSARHEFMISPDENHVFVSIHQQETDK